MGTGGAGTKANCGTGGSGTANRGGGGGGAGGSYNPSYSNIGVIIVVLRAHFQNIKGTNSKATLPGQDCTSDSHQIVQRVCCCRQ